jgi:hemolysin activation/secretion protein
MLCAAFTTAAAGHSAAQGAPSSAEHGTSRFDVQEYRVLGNSVLDVRTIETAVYPHLGPQKEFQDVEAARAALEAAYHDHGYGTVFVDVPEQSVDDGVVRLRVTEGRLQSVTISGAQYFSERQIRAAIPAATPGAVPSIPALQAQIVAVNAVTPDRSVVPVLKAGPEPGTVDLAMKVNDRLPLHGYVELNNQYPFDTKPLRATGYVSYDDLFGKFDSISLQYLVAPQQKSDSQLLAAGYVAPAGPGRVSATFIDSRSNVAAVGALSVIGNGKIYGLHYDLPFQATPSGVQTVSAGVDYKRFGQNVLTSPTAQVESPIAYALVSVNYAGSYLTVPRTWTWSGGAAFAIPGIGSTPQEYSNKCFECRPNFFLTKGDASLLQNLSHGFAAVLRLAAQYSPTPVVTNEQFILGGAYTVRGYYEAEELGDLGWRGTFELRAPTVFAHTERVRLAPFLYTDYGRLGYQAPLPSQPSSFTLGSVGAGFELGAFGSVSGNLTWSRALHTAGHTDSGDSRVLFDIRSAW